MRLDVVGLEFQSFLIVRNCFIWFALLTQKTGQVVMRFGIGRIDTKRATVKFHTISGITVRLVDFAEIIVSDGSMRGDPQSVFPQRFAIAPNPHLSLSQQAQGSGRYKDNN